ncbi:MAG: hypothetical protein ABFC90_07385 [Bacteroidales bacterium]|nr:hypothetical protein [Bacteroidales bacterium]
MASNDTIEVQRFAMYKYTDDLENELFRLRGENSFLRKNAELSKEIHYPDKKSGVKIDFSTGKRIN